MTDVLSRVTVWELDHPEGTKEECEAWLRSEHASGSIQIPAAPSGSERAGKPKAKRGNGAGADNNQKKTKKGSAPS